MLAFSCLEHLTYMMLSLFQERRYNNNQQMQFHGERK